MTPVRFLLDTSALARILRSPAARERWESQITAGLVAVCPIIELEVLYTARSKADREEILDLLNAAFAWVPMPERVFARAAEVQAALTAQGTHRSASAVDLLVAAAAELQSLTLVHYDHDFDQVTAVTGQPACWLAPPGSLD
ncbi:MAG: PIN domain nuclease [Micromonosporaceae bacterium]|nr:PIN domain nuclease [Micromonosporaceae bacterium]